MDGANGLQVVWVLANATTPGGWTSEQTAMINRLVPTSASSSAFAMP